MVLPISREQNGYQGLSNIQHGTVPVKLASDSPFRRLLENLRKYAVKQQEEKESEAALNMFRDEAPSDDDILRRIIQNKLDHQPLIALQDPRKQ